MLCYIASGGRGAQCPCGRKIGQKPGESSGVTCRGAEFPQRILTGKFLLTYNVPGKKRQGKKGKGVEIKKKRRKIIKGRWKIENGRWKSYKMRSSLLFFFFFVLSLFKTAKICFGSTKMEIFYQEKASHAGKKIRKKDFAPSEKFPVTPLGESRKNWVKNQEEKAKINVLSPCPS